MKKNQLSLVATPPLSFQSRYPLSWYFNPTNRGLPGRPDAADGVRPFAFTINQYFWHRGREGRRAWTHRTSARATRTGCHLLSSAHIHPRSRTRERRVIRHRYIAGADSAFVKSTRSIGRGGEVSAVGAKHQEVCDPRRPRERACDARGLRPGDAAAARPNTAVLPLGAHLGFGFMRNPCQAQTSTTAPVSESNRKCHSLTPPTPPRPVPAAVHPLASLRSLSEKRRDKRP